MFQGKVWGVVLREERYCGGWTPRGEVLQGDVPGGEVFRGRGTAGEGTRDPVTDFDVGRREGRGRER